MKITYSINMKILTSSGKPTFSFKCEHCRKSLDLAGAMYAEKRNGGVDPAAKPKQAAQEFVWKLNSGYAPKSVKNHLCFCDENPKGIVGRWFRTNSRKIEKSELDLACSQIRLYAYKDGLNPDGKEANKAVEELIMAVKKHNAEIRNATNAPKNPSKI